MQAIILAAGMGKRLGDLTKDNTKCMIKVNGVTLIERMLQQITHQGIRKIIMVVGFRSERLKSFIATLSYKYDIEYVENPVYETTNNIYSLYLAKDYLLKDDTLLFESDLIFEDKLIEEILVHPYPNLALVAKFESWMDGTVVTLDDEQNIVKFITKESFVFEEITSYFKTVNIYKFSKEFSDTRYVPFLEAYSKALGNNEYYEQVLKVIALLDQPDIKALDIRNLSWYEIDDIQDLNIAESIFADEESRLIKLQQRYGGYWRYPHIIDFCYLVNPYFPNKKLLSEIKANFERLLIEYPSGLAINNLLAAKYFWIKPEYVCVGNGAAELIKSLMNITEGKVGINYPTFEEYPNRYSTDRIIRYTATKTDFHYTADNLMQYYEDKDISCLLLINPDNPSGNFIPKHDVIRLLNWTQDNNIRMIVDESFVDFSENFEQNSLLKDEVLEKYKNLVVVKSISKSYGVPGLRLGIVASSDLELMALLKNDISIWNINSFAEFYMQIYGKYEQNYKTACRIFVAERERFRKQLSQISFLRVIPSQANYFLCEVIGRTAGTLTRELLKHNILIKDCSGKHGFENKEYVRIAVRNTIDNDLLIEKLRLL
ncbi:MAG: aminotransferase class I/II-fold pyridoxal phosphate-dependent enzyme [Dysgonomonas sp.]|uniref:aminotransferase class I/II-fold pyridoxal phosphate-dependent enzyme n=1 Tax=Dysgonomonas sp. TaxID=1891233 RepID=UPI003A8C2A93